MAEIISYSPEEASNQHENIEERPEVLTTRYLGEVTAYKALQSGLRSRDSQVLTPLAESYHYYSEYFRSKFDESIKKYHPLSNQLKAQLMRTTALSLAREGNYERAEMYLQLKKGRFPPVDYAVAYAQICTEQNLDPAPAFAIALQSANASHEKLENYWKIAVAQSHANQDPQHALDAYAEIRTQKHNRLLNYVWINRYEDLLLKCGRPDEAIALLESEETNQPEYANRKERFQNSLAIYWIEAGDVEKGLAVLRNSNMKNLPNNFDTLANLTLHTTKGTVDDRVLFAELDAMFITLEKIGKNYPSVIAKKAELDFMQGKEINHHIQTLVKGLDKTDPRLVVEDLREVIALVKKTGQKTEPYLYQLLGKLSDLLRSADFNEKIDGLEAAMEYENTIEFLIEHEFLNEASLLIEQYIPALSNDSGDSIGEELFAERMQAELAKKYLELADSGKGIKTSNKNQYFKALGYFNLSYDSTHLTVSEQTLINVGRAQREVLQNGTEVEVFTASDNTGATIKNVIQSEIERGTDARQIRRLVKELLEMGDTEIQKQAVTMFTDPEQPLHFRLYIAKKLCNGGVWDRQILYYFNQYKNEADKAPAMRDRVETLETIITELHQTPSLEIYKVLEKTRTERDHEAMEKVAHFGSQALMIEEMNLKDKISLFSHWADRYNEGQINDTELSELTLHIKSLGEAWISYRNTHANHDRYNTIKTSSRAILHSEEIFHGLDETTALLRQGIFPTDSLIESLRLPNGFVQLMKLEERTKKGQFDITNIPQRDLEFSKYLKITKQAALPILKQAFVTLPSSEDSREVPELDYKEKNEATAAAYECAKLYWFVKDLKDQGRNVVVIGNKRYGQYFVTEPLRRELSRIGIPLRDLYIRSSGAHEDSYPEDIPDTFVKLLAEESPDIVIVDGTKRRQGNASRLPNSFHGFYNWFEAFNQAQKSYTGITEKATDTKIQRLQSFHPKNSYQIRFWTPQETESIYLGSTILQNPPEEELHPSVYFVNSVIHPADATNYPKELQSHEPAFFDDPDTHVKNTDIIRFTKHGIKNQGDKFALEEDYVSQVQAEIERHIPEYIRRTDPLVGQNSSDTYRSTYRFSGS